MDQTDWCSYGAKHGSQSCTCLKQSQQEDNLESQMLPGGLLKGLKGSLVSWCRKTAKGSRGDAPLVLRVCLYGTIQEMSEIPSLLTLMGEFPFVSQG